jgi:hypothetical protein
MDAESPAEAAVAAIAAEILKYDGNALKKRMAPPEEAAAAPPGDESCPECAAGTCDNPEHMGDEDAAGLLASLGGE